MHSEELTNFCNQLLEEGRKKLNLTMGIVSHISGGNYKIFAVSSEAEVFVAGEIYPLEATYCRDVYKSKKTIALTEIEGCKGLKHHPLYDSMALESYISSPILVKGEVWGTINFSCMDIRENPFTADEIAFTEDSAKQIAEATS
ncbi:MAG: GAF domain-containing protein [SAR324 cluster bacterium]|nr:GAF domain-containing protein [SAR324 cluster bacterium]